MSVKDRILEAGRRTCGEGETDTRHSNKETYIPESCDTHFKQRNASMVAVEVQVDKPITAGEIELHDHVNARQFTVTGTPILCATRVAAHVANLRD